MAFKWIMVSGAGGAGIGGGMVAGIPTLVVMGVFLFIAGLAGALDDA